MEICGGIGGEGIRAGADYAMFLAGLIALQRATPTARAAAPIIGHRAAASACSFFVPVGTEPVATAERGKLDLNLRASGFGQSEAVRRVAAAEMPAATRESFEGRHA